MATTVNGVKMEGDSYIKSEADFDSPASYMDDDQYEDTGELTIPDDTPGIWLTRIDRDLWNSLSAINSDEEIQIGEVRVYEKTDKAGNQKMRMYLKNDFPGFANVPKEYNFHVTNMASTNTFVFSERDMAGYRPGVYRKNNFPPLGSQESNASGHRVPKPKSKFKKAIPKHTALAAWAQHEFRCHPVQNEEYTRLTTRDRIQPSTRHLISFDKRDIPRLQNEGRRAADAFHNFIRTGAPPGGRRGQDNKAARIPQNELLDMLHRLFKEYKFWPLKALKQRTRQPESYLKETLQKIAVLIKSGPKANTWTLKPEMQEVEYAGLSVSEEAAPDLGGGTDAESADDEDENVEMEDVV